MKKLTIFVFASILGFGLPVMAQEASEGKIKIEISKEINGERRTFKGEYNSTEEMKADPNYQEFAGKDEDFNFSFGDMEEDQLSIHLDQLKGLSKSFKFFDGGDDDNFFFKHLDGSDDGNFFFKYFDEEGADKQIFDFNLDDHDFEEFNEKMQELGIDFEEMLDKFKDSDPENRVRIITFRKVSVSNVEGDEFGKKGAVAENRLLELEDLEFSPNPSSNGKFKVKFSVPEEKELSVKVYNLEGKEVFERYFERFGGTFSEVINLSEEEEGIYLLEIMQGNKRLTRKVSIK